MNRNAVRGVLNSYGLNGSEIAVDQSKPLWGRVKWTAMYAERIIEEVIKRENINSDDMSAEEYEQWVQKCFAEKKEVDFKTLVGETYERVVGELCAKLGVIQKRGDSEHLLDKLLEAAISADILGRAHVFHRKLTSNWWSRVLQSWAVGLINWRVTLLL